MYILTMHVTSSQSLPLPARALQSRIQVALEPDHHRPSWMAWLPAKAQPTQRPVDHADGNSCEGNFEDAHTDTDNCHDLHVDRTMEGYSRHDTAPAPWVSRSADCIEYAGQLVHNYEMHPSKVPYNMPSVEPGDSRADAQEISGRVWDLSRDQQGCRHVQDVLDNTTSRVQEAIAYELRGHVWEASRCPHANYVLQKCITVLRPQARQYVIEELVLRKRGVIDVSKHRYGCRIIQRLLEHCSCAQVERIMEILLAGLKDLCLHAYGNYVVQHMIEHCRDMRQRRRLFQIITEGAPEMALDQHACAIVSKALSHGTPDEKLGLARVLAHQTNLLSDMALTRHGHVAAKTVLETLTGNEKEVASQNLLRNERNLRSSRYGRHVLPAVSPMPGSCSQDSDDSVHAAGGA